MGYLTIKQLNSSNIILKKKKSYYLVGYMIKNIILSSLSITLKDIDIKKNEGFYIIVKDKESIKQLNMIDEYLNKYIDNYKNILHPENNYVYLKCNDYLNNYLNNYDKKEITINIIKLKITASHTFPIVYIL